MSKLESRENPIQVVGLPRHLIPCSGAASRLLAAKTLHVKAERRRSAGAHLLGARAGGQTSDRAAAVGALRSTLERWRKRTQPPSRRPHRLRGENRPAGLAAFVERLRLDFPMWGNTKIGQLARERGSCASDAAVGRILSDLTRRGRAAGAPACLRKTGPRSAPNKRPYATRGR